MTRIVVFSDTHRKISDAVKVLENLINVDMVIHLGDCVCDAVDLRRAFGDIPFYFVRGNNDFYSDHPSELVVEADGVKIFCVHGHNHNLDRLVNLSRDKGCKVALFGHTHQGFQEKIDNILVLNPGSISRPRDYKKSYGVIEIENKNVNACIIDIERM